MRRFLQDDAGAAGVEYGILIAAIAAAIIVAAFTIGDQVAAAFSHVSTEIENGCPQCAVGDGGGEEDPA